MNKIISKRGTEVPFIIVEGKRKGPLLVMIHGFSSNKHEDNRYLKIAEELKEIGVNSIMFSQCGHEESKEDFINYTLDNIIDDTYSCIEYMIDNYQIDKNNISLIGYSMGARIVSLIMNKIKAKNIVLIAGANYKGLSNDNDSFLGHDVNDLRKQANEHNCVNIYDPFEDRYLKLSKRFIENMEEYNPIEQLNKYNGNALIIHGMKDDIVSIKKSYLVYNELINTKEKRLIIFKDSDHSFGGWSSNLNIEESNLMCEKIINYLKERV